MRDEVNVPPELLKAAYDAGSKLRAEYSGQVRGHATNNRAMELAFLWGLLDFPFEDTKIVVEALR